MLTPAAHAAIRAMLAAFPNEPDAAIVQRLKARGVQVSRSTVWRARWGYHPYHFLKQHDRKSQ